MPSHNFDNVKFCRIQVASGSKTSTPRHMIKLMLRTSRSRPDLARDPHQIHDLGIRNLHSWTIRITLSIKTGHYRPRATTARTSVPHVEVIQPWKRERRANDGVVTVTSCPGAVPTAASPR